MGLGSEKSGQLGVGHGPCCDLSGTRGMKMLQGLLGPVFNVHLMKPLLSFWYGYNKKRLVPRLMRKVFTREFLAAKHHSGITYEEVRRGCSNRGGLGSPRGRHSGRTEVSKPSGAGLLFC